MTVAEIRSVPFARPWITDEERRAVDEVLKSPILTHGPQGKAFEEEFGTFLGEGAHAVAVSSCMAALHLACVHLGLGPGDEVIVPAQTHTATVHAVEWVGATPIFVDCDPLTGNLTPDGIDAAITNRTKAIAVVHFVGIPCDMPAIMAIAERKQLKVIEDCALSLGARIHGRHVGLFGDAGCFSFYPAKHITTGEGGMLVTRHQSVAEAIKALRAFGVDRTHQERTVPGMYDVPTLGLNYRMSEIQAAIGRAQMRRLAENLSRRRNHFGAIQQALSHREDLRILDAQDQNARSSHYCLCLVVGERRDAIASQLYTAGIGTSIYYPHPVPRLSYYRNKYGYEASRFVHATGISDGSLALPVGPHLHPHDVTQIVDQVRRVVEEVRQ